MTSLNDLLNNDLRTAFDNTTAADDFQPLPNGAYEMEVASIVQAESKTGKPKCVVKWRAIDGEYVGRFVWQDLWLTPAALPMAKRELKKLGITQFADIGKPLPTDRVYRVQVVVRVRDGGANHNEVKRFDYLRTEVEPFAPSIEEIALASLSAEINDELDHPEKRDAEIEKELEEGKEDWVKDLQQAAKEGGNG